MRLDDYTRHVADLCLDLEPRSEAVASLGGDRERWLRYRRMVRRRLTDSVAAVFPRLEAALGEPSFEAMMDAFFASRGLASPFIRDVPGEVLAFLDGASTGSLDLPDHAVDLAKLEWAERAVLYAEDDAVAEAPPLAMGAAVVLTRAHRLLALRHAVHDLDAGEPRAPAARPTFLCVYRDEATHEARVLSLSGAAHALLEALSDRVSLEEAIRRAAARSDATVDRAFLESLSELLADLSARGVVRGART
ncbi:MAG TPA: putative DNA-binding domain-containing protein [Polyangiaceae bacterium]|nr:putative DNA-binding domain-containing protein [Polyangiaceae bacterium]